MGLAPLGCGQFCPAGSRVFVDSIHDIVLKVSLQCRMALGSVADGGRHRGRFKVGCCIFRQGLLRRFLYLTDQCDQGDAQKRAVQCRSHITLGVPNIALMADQRPLYVGMRNLPHPRFHDLPKGAEAENRDDHHVGQEPSLHFSHPPEDFL